MFYKIKVDVLMTDSESSSVQETVNRTILLLPNGEYGVSYKRGIYQLHDLNGSSGHIHANNPLPYEYVDCPAFDGELLVSGVAVVKGAIDFSGRSRYLVFSCDENMLLTILEDLEYEGVSWSEFKPSIRAAGNGQHYTQWIRLTKGSNGSNSIASLEAESILEKIDRINSKGKYRILIDDVI